MLKLLNLKKDYILKDQEPVHALKGVTLAFRRNEFVAILGPSGCGKTTLLNIIGGLDRYSGGCLYIEGKSTLKYSDRDWDTYRNHSIGFVFQAYNLISHRNIVDNVELALTISGVSKRERRKRAFDVLAKVGLKGMEKKKPNQLSGGQMQRVAIARALINNPEILLADEPTGALDSETSIQIMDLLKEVAKNRLVIMVTHNPDLAKQYATRIVTMKDGLITGDTMPYKGESKIEKEKAHEERRLELAAKGKKEKTSMSFFTASGLSGSNLLSKFKRTVLIAIAGSIGIIGISSVLSVSNGVSSYTTNMQDDMLSAYPLQIAEESIDLSSLMSGLSSSGKKDIVIKSQEVGVDQMIAYMMDKYKDFNNVKTNDINEYLLKYIDEIPEEYLASISYNYGLDLTNNIYTTWKEGDNSISETVSLNGLTQQYISSLKTIEGFSEYSKFVSLFTNFMKPLPGSNEYLLSQYDLVKGDFATKEDEIMIVIDNKQSLTDIFLGQMGYFTQDQFFNVVRKALEEQKDNPDPELLEKYDYPSHFTYDEIMDKELIYYPHDSMWNYTMGYYNYQGHAPSSLTGGMPVKIKGILKPKANVKFGSMSRGVYYTDALVKKFIKDSENSDLVNGTNGLKNWVYNENPDVFKGLVLYQFTSYENGETNPVKKWGYAQAFNANNDISSILSPSGVSSEEVNKIYLRTISGLATKTKTVLGTKVIYFEILPKAINIYPKSFNQKGDIKAYLNVWNSDKTIELKDGTIILREMRSDITVTDTVEMIVTLINTLITSVTIALISFTSLSLIVSCFMIAIITYISTMERVKEIGVIRSLGGRKKDVSRLFIAETLIIGLFSGLIGVGVTYILSLIINIVATPFGISTLASLPIWVALIMIALAIVLNVISGLIPSYKASKQDPVIALRSE